MTEKRYSLLYGIDENPYEWDIIDNEKNSIIYQSNGIAICNELNELNDELEKLTILYSAKCKTEETLIKEGERLEKENKELKASLYAEKTNTAEVVNDYAKQFKRYSTEFSFMIDLAKDLGVDIKSLEASDD